MKCARIKLNKYFLKIILLIVAICFIFNEIGETMMRRSKIFLSLG